MLSAVPSRPSLRGRHQHRRSARRQNGDGGAGLLSAVLVGRVCEAAITQKERAQAKRRRRSRVAQRGPSRPSLRGRHQHRRSARRQNGDGGAGLLQRGPSRPGPLGGGSGHPATRRSARRQNGDGGAGLLSAVLGSGRPQRSRVPQLRANPRVSAARTAPAEDPAAPSDPEFRNSGQTPEFQALGPLPRRIRPPPATQGSATWVLSCPATGAAGESGHASLPAVGCLLQILR